MPATSRKQQRFMFAMLREQEKTGHNKTGMSADKLKEFTHLKKGAPEAAKSGKGRKQLIGD